MLVLLVHVYSKNEPTETFNISFESKQNTQQYDTNITCAEVRKKVMIRNLVRKKVMIRNLIMKKSEVLGT